MIYICDNYNYNKKYFSGIIKIIYLIPMLVIVLGGTGGMNICDNYNYNKKYFSGIIKIIYLIPMLVIVLGGTGGMNCN